MGREMKLRKDVGSNPLERAEENNPLRSAQHLHLKNIVTCP
jgi:hypothetical protein